MQNKIFVSLIVVCISAGATFGQTTPFTYQGKLTDTGNLANGAYDFQFKLFDALNSGAQQGSTLALNGVIVTNGVFSVNLDFGVCASCFPGADRFLEIGVKPNGGGAFATLTPRQQITLTPYAIRSLTATSADGLSLACVGCVTSSQIQNVQGSQIAGAIPVSSVPAGSANYIQNTTSQQTTSNFNISGDGFAGGTLSSDIVNATTQFNVGGNRILSKAGTNNIFLGIGTGQVNVGSGNTFVGANSGPANTSGGGNAFFGNAAGLSNTTGLSNSFFGSQAGQSGTTGGSNSFFGFQAGFSTTTAGSNAFFGTFAGLFNSTGTNNTFVGMNAGRANTTAAANSFFGRSAGQANTTGASNSFFGFNAGLANTTGGNNSFFGQNAGSANTIGLHNSFFGDSAGAANTSSFNSFFGDSAGLSNTSGTANAFFGRAAGQSNTTGNDNSLFGFNAGVSNTGGQNSFFGRSAGAANTSGANNAFFGYNAGAGNTSGAHNSFFGDNAGAANATGSNNTFIGADTNSFNGFLDHATAIGAGALVFNNNWIELGRTADTVEVPGKLEVVSVLEVVGLTRFDHLDSSSTPLCINGLGELASCSSSLRYKSNVSDYVGGLSIINRLHPISFTWKANRTRDIGLAAEQVAGVEPLFTFSNKQGEIEGVKYSQLSVVFINAIKEQQTEIRRQQLQLARQRREIEAVKRLVCSGHPKAVPCRPSRPGTRTQRR